MYIYGPSVQYFVFVYPMSFARWQRSAMSFFAITVALMLMLIVFPAKAAIVYKCDGNVMTIARQIKARFRSKS